MNTRNTQTIHHWTNSHPDPSYSQADRTLTWLIKPWFTSRMNVWIKVLQRWTVCIWIILNPSAWPTCLIHGSIGDMKNWIAFESLNCVEIDRMNFLKTFLFRANNWMNGLKMAVEPAEMRMEWLTGQLISILSFEFFQIFVPFFDLNLNIRMF